VSVFVTLNIHGLILKHPPEFADNRKIGDSKPMNNKNIILSVLLINSIFLAYLQPFGIFAKKNHHDKNAEQKTPAIPLFKNITGVPKGTQDG
jgi:hypothetical protein